MKSERDRFKGTLVDEEEEGGQLYHVWGEWVDERVAPRLICKKRGNEADGQKKKKGNGETFRESP